MYENISDFDLGKLFLSQKNRKDELAEKRLIDKEYIEDMYLHCI